MQPDLDSFTFVTPTLWRKEIQVLYSILLSISDYRHHYKRTVTRQPSLRPMEVPCSSSVMDIENLPALTL
jgi:hypothetical protein